jgi:hypothetical protein
VAASAFDNNQQHSKEPTMTNLVIVVVVVVIFVFIDVDILGQ